MHRNAHRSFCIFSFITHNARTLIGIHTQQVIDKLLRRTS